jgi:DNA-3-methyladenine glycosylase II
MHLLRDGPVVRVPVASPFRLDFTVAALQRVPANPVEVWTDDGRYLRAFDAPSGPLVWEVTQGAQHGPLALRLHGGDAETECWVALLRRMLGCDVDLSGFYALAAEVPVLAELAGRFRGLKPPRFATLWESLVNTIAFQQLSLASGMAAVVRLASRCTRPIVFRGVSLRPFPGAEAVDRLGDEDLRACGFSSAKVRSLRAAAAAVLGGALREEELERLPDEEAAVRLTELPGVGTWTSSLLLLRGLGRLGSFPAGDSGANRRLHATFGPVDPARLLARLGAWRGMLYFHLLLTSRFRSGAGSIIERTVVKTKRAYQAAARMDGFRVLVDRLWPRGVSKDAARIDLWAKDLAPSPELRRWFGHEPGRFRAFAARYRHELSREPARTAFADLVRRASHGTVTLIYGARDEEHNGAVVLQQEIESALGPHAASP